jgi:uncharacterized delta-60 repeat protein
LAIQQDGKIVVVGYARNNTDSDFAIYRYNTNGTLDTTFSGDGISIGNFGLNHFDLARDMAIQSDGKIVVAGYSYDTDVENSDFAIVRLNANGTVDTTFSGDGRQIANFGAIEDAYGIAMQTDGKIVVVGRKSTTSIGYIAIARFNTNGSLDTTFNNTGKKLFSIVSMQEPLAEDLIVQPDGKIVVLANTTSNGTVGFNFALARLNPSGAFDNTFSADGKVIIDFGGDDRGHVLVRQPSTGKYILGGSADGDFALARVLP